MDKKLSITTILTVATFIPTVAMADVSSKDIEKTGFRLEVSYKDFFPECRENYQDVSCRWKFLVISRPPLNEPTGYITSGEYDLTLPIFLWNLYQARIRRASSPHCSVDITSNLVSEISKQRKNDHANWIAALPTELSGCFNGVIVNAAGGTDVYWAIKDNVVVASISCSPHGTVPNPSCGVEFYIEDGSVAIVGGYFPYVNIEKFLLEFSKVTLNLSDHIFVKEYREDVKDIFGDDFEIDDVVKDMARRKREEIDGEY